MIHERMAGKIEGYVRYRERRLHTRKYPGMQSFIVASVTATRARDDALWKDLLPLIPQLRIERCVSLRPLRAAYACYALAEGRRSEGRLAVSDSYPLTDRPFPRTLKAKSDPIRSNAHEDLQFQSCS